MQTDVFASPSAAPVVYHSKLGKRREPEASPLTETQTLTWLLVQGTIEACEKQRLETLLAQSDTSCREYFDIWKRHGAKRDTIPSHENFNNISGDLLNR